MAGCKECELTKEEILNIISNAVAGVKGADGEPGADGKSFGIDVIENSPSVDCPQGSFTFNIGIDEDFDGKPEVITKSITFCKGFIPTSIDKKIIFKTHTFASPVCDGQTNSSYSEVFQAYPDILLSDDGDTAIVKGTVLFTEDTTYPNDKFKAYFTIEDTFVLQSHEDLGSPDETGFVLNAQMDFRIEITRLSSGSVLVEGKAYPVNADLQIPYPVRFESNIVNIPFSLDTSGINLGVFMNSCDGQLVKRTIELEKAD